MPFPSITKWGRDGVAQKQKLIIHKYNDARNVKRRKKYG
jgi:hypothetical protein